MMESFSADLPPAIKRYWTESHLELLILLRLNPGVRGEHLTACLLFFESMWSVLICLCWWSSSGVLNWCWCKFCGEFVIFQRLSMELRYLTLIPESEISAGLHSRNLLFHIKSYRIIQSLKVLWLVSISVFHRRSTRSFPRGHGAFTLLKLT